MLNIDQVSLLLLRNCSTHSSIYEKRLSRPKKTGEDALSIAKVSFHRVRFNSCQRGNAAKGDYFCTVYTEHNVRLSTIACHLKCPITLYMSVLTKFNKTYKKCLHSRQVILTSMLYATIL